MNLIVAADNKWGIGRDGGLLASIPTDMKYFKEHTTGKVVVMGRRTLESFPGGRPLHSFGGTFLLHQASLRPQDMPRSARFS